MLILIKADVTAWNLIDTNSINCFQVRKVAPNYIDKNLDCLEHKDDEVLLSLSALTIRH